MWFSTTKMGCSHCFLAYRPSSSFYKRMILVVTVGSFSLGYIFLTSMILIVSTVFFTSFSSRSSKRSEQKFEEEEGCSTVKMEGKYLEDVTEIVMEQVAEKAAFVIQEVIQGHEGIGSMHKALDFSATVAEEKCTGDKEDETDDDHCRTSSEDEEDRGNNYEARSSLSSEADGSISDEDTLIEIELPTGHYLSPKKHKHNTRHKPRRMELLSEANIELATEEDNLIEIDISVGSIMYPRFETEA